MTIPTLALEGVSHVLPDGRTLFSDLHEIFDLCPTGLVGRNGVGKTVLAHILAGELQPSAGRRVCTGSVCFLAQQVSHPPCLTLAGLAGVQDALDALERIESGSVLEADFGALGDRWDIRQQLQLELERNGLGHLHAATPVGTLSGGETMRVALIGALLSNADFLILDEPSNHLDQPNRRALIEQLQRWPRGLLVVSHDRQLLDAVARIVELSPVGLQSYGGNYAFYAQSKAVERQSALRQLEHCKLERQRQERSMQQQHARQARRLARGKRVGREANQAKILLDRQKERSEGSTGRLLQQHDALRQELARRVSEAAGRLDQDTRITLHQPQASPCIRRRRMLEMTDVALPYAADIGRHIDLILDGGSRVGVVGPNGCGKSTLLKVIAGQLQPVGGLCRVGVKVAYLDQRLSNLDPQRSVLEQLRVVSRGLSDGELRMRLSQLGLEASNIVVPSGALSGGERLKAALACVVYADPPAQLLLLDEPSNHLDLPSLRALEAMLCCYTGSLMVVSHDGNFLAQLGLTHRLAARAGGWTLEPWG